MGVHVGEAEGEEVLRLLCTNCDAHYETDETTTNECPECGLQDYRVCDDTLPQLHVGDHVQDRQDGDDDSTPTMLVVATPLEQADEYVVDGEQTVADYNPEEYPSDDDVVEVVFPSRTDNDLAMCNRYAYPRQRLKRVGAVHSDGGEE